MNIRLATIDDIEDILMLLKKYHIDSIQTKDKPDGFVTTNMNFQQMKALVVEEQGITIAKEQDILVGFAMAGSWDFWSQWPLFEYMIQRLSEHLLEHQILSVANSYQYGPICIDQSVRGTGVFEKIFNFSLQSMHERFPYMVTFINQINHRSYRAHTQKVPMTKVGTFQFNQNKYYVMACSTENKEAVS